MPFCSESMFEVLCGVKSSPELSRNLISHHVVYSWILFICSVLRPLHAFTCCHAPACLRVLVGASLINTNSAQIACAISNLILPKIQSTILLAQQPKNSCNYFVLKADLIRGHLVSLNLISTTLAVV